MLLSASDFDDKLVLVQLVLLIAFHLFLPLLKISSWLLVLHEMCQIVLKILYSDFYCEFLAARQNTRRSNSAAIMQP